ncbi:hypothetical protein SELMODRAFT_72365, partial [Selaginella moellendorffii]
NTLLQAHAQAGHTDQCRRIFAAMPDPDAISWSTLIQAFAQNGHGDLGVELFGAMILDGVVPTAITFISVLSGFNHVGMLDRGREIFHSIAAGHGLAITLQHYSAMVGILGRSKLLDEAEELAHSMPFLPDAQTWTELLAACVLHGDLERAERAATSIHQLEPKCPSSFLLLSS